MDGYIQNDDSLGEPPVICEPQVTSELEKTREDEDDVTT